MSAWDDDTAQGYATRYGDDPSQFWVLERAPMSAMARVLDIGCGTGAALRSLANGTRQLTGVDPTPRMIDIARTAGEGITYHVAGAEALPLSEQSVDVVLMLNVVHHFDDPTLGLDEALRVLADGGLLVIGGETFGADMLPGGQDYEEGLAARGLTQIQRYDGDGVFAVIAKKPGDRDV